ncbi:MAG: ribosome biogenesis factor YjgA [Betaproteobacteria bacterium]
MVSDAPRPSKTQQKKHMHALQEMGAELVGLNDAQLASIALPEPLREAVMAAKRMSRFEARRRQLQYIGKLMREVDPEPIRARLDGWKASSREQTARLHRIERWRERLTEDDEALSEFIAAHPRADARQLRALVRNTRRERLEGRPPKYYRALFHAVRDTLELDTEATHTHDDQG